MKHFNEAEKEYISKQLILKGHDLFSRYGIRKTSIEEIAKAVGIAKGSFYAFFNSKEDLFLRILVLEITKLKQENNFDPQNTEPQKIIMSYLSHVLKNIISNPILNKMLIREEYEAIYRKIAIGEISNDIHDFSDPLVSVLKIWKEKGFLIDENIDVLTGIIKSIFLISRFRNEIGERIYDKVVDYLIEFISEGITIKGK